MRGILDYRIPENQDLAQTALLSPAVKINENRPKNGGPAITGPRLAVTTIKATDQKRFVKTKYYNSIRVLPGSYDLGLTCVGGSFQQEMSQVLTVEAGNDYYLACTGDTKRTAKLVITIKPLRAADTVK